MIGGRVQSGRVRQDPYPRMRPAGWIPFGTEDVADHCIRQDVHQYAQNNNQRPQTPEHIRKYRRSTQMEPGIRQVHYGFMDDINAPDYKKAFGKKTNESLPLDKVIKAQNLTGLADKFNDIKEGHYASSIREPLGKTYIRGHELPAQTHTSGFKFGVPSGVTINAKELLYPAGGSYEERPETAAMYEQTHGNIAAGVQRKRNYAWTLNPDEHSFGYSEQKLLNGVAKSVHQERIDEAFPKTVIVKKDLEDYRGMTQDQLGSVRNLGQGFHPLPQNHTYGVTRDMSDQWNAAKCIQGEPSDNQLQPDSDLGTCVKVGARNVLRREEDRDRAFGVPTIRNDIPGKKQKSVADYQNYGDEPEAVDVLFPATHVEIGVQESDFAQPRQRAAIKQLFENIGYSYRPGKFNAIYNRALALMPVEAPYDQVSCRAFMTAISMLHNVQ